MNRRLKGITKAEFHSLVVEARRTLAQVMGDLSVAEAFELQEALMEVEGIASSLRAAVEHQDHEGTNSLGDGCFYCYDEEVGR
jgi:hypothetical protein